MQTIAAEVIKSSKRLGIKVGSAILCAPDGAIRKDWLHAFCDDLISLKQSGTEVIIVTSGAVSLGRSALGLGANLRLEEKQAASATGQALLIDAWRKGFEKSDLVVAQILLTLDDTENRRRYLNARNTIATLLEMGAIPVVNENDTIATAEIRYGDNDRLAAHAAQLGGADCLIILSDVDGLYSADPRKKPDAQHISFSAGVTPEMLSAAAGPNLAAGVGTGGMKTKLSAAKIASACGCATVIAEGKAQNPILSILSGARATLIQPELNPDSARRQWIAGRLKPFGALVIDQGAFLAVQAGASLLAAGITSVQGKFSRGDAVQLLNAQGNAIGQGLVTLDSKDVDAIKGLQTSDIEAILGYRRRPAIIDRKDLILDTTIETLSDE